MKGRKGELNASRSAPSRVFSEPSSEIGFAEALRKTAAHALQPHGKPSVGLWPVEVVGKRTRSQAHGLADRVAETAQALGGAGLDAEKIDQDVHILVDDGLEIAVAAIIQHLIPVRHLTAEESPQQEHALRHIK